MTTSLKILFLSAVLLLIGGLNLFADEPLDANPTFTKAADIIAILPFANYSGSADAFDIYIPKIELYLQEQGYQIINSHDCYEVLRKYRIRSAGSISKDDAQAVADDTNAKFLLLGSIDFIGTRFLNESGFSVRLLDTKSNKIIWAKSVATTGEDYISIFGLGNILSPDSLATRLTSAAFENMIKEVSEYSELKNKKQLAYAVVPFNNSSSSRYAGDIIYANMLSELISQGIDVLEPGFMLELFRKNNRLAIGEINHNLLTQLNSTYRIKLVITGTVEVYNPGRAETRSASPQIEFGCRFIDTSTGFVIAAHDLSDNGLKYESFFKQGAIKSLGKLSRKNINKMIHKLNDRRERWYVLH